MKYFTMYGRMFGRSVLLAAALVAVFVGTASAQKGSFTDSRDGQKYKTVKIGKQTWMSENLNYKTGNSWCYNDDESKCKQYGRLYYWGTARTACPSGWHLPSREEWSQLADAVKGTVYSGGKSMAGHMLKAKSGWIRDGNGSDAFGFSGLPGGLRGNDGTFDEVGYRGYWWTASENSIEGGPYFRVMDNAHVDLEVEFSYDETVGFSVRCVQD